MTETILKSNFGTARLSDTPPGFYAIISTKPIFSASYVIFFQAIFQPSFSLDERQQRVKVLCWYARIYICNRFSLYPTIFEPETRNMQVTYFKGKGLPLTLHVVYATKISVTSMKFVTNKNPKSTPNAWKKAFFSFWIVLFDRFRQKTLLCTNIHFQY